jgi:mannitol/fructose-specific phosphotransferase system IIA component (Ntr-type)
MSPSAAQFLQPDRVLLEIAASEKDAAIMEVAAVLRPAGDMEDFTAFCRELGERERLRSTASGYGVAFPHARTDAVREILIAAGRSTAGIRFGDELVHYIFVIGTPREKAGDYLVAVGTLARALRSEKTRNALAAAQTPEEFLRALTT